MSRSGEFTFALKATFPVFLGYSALGMAFGFLLAQAGLPFWLAPVMSLVMYAGAAQFLAVGFFAAGAGLAESVVTIFLVNARHMVYGLSLLEEFRPIGPARWYAVFALTDETYALLTGLKVPPGLDRGRVVLLVSGLNQCWWLLGGIAGVLAGSLVRVPAEGLGFALTALFMVLATGQVSARPGGFGRWRPVVVGLGACAVTWPLFGGGFLLPAVILAVAAQLALAFTEPSGPDAAGGEAAA